MILDFEVVFKYGTKIICIKIKKYINCILNLIFYVSKDHIEIENKRQLTMVGNSSK